MYQLHITWVLPMCSKTFRLFTTTVFTFSVTSIWELKNHGLAFWKSWLKSTQVDYGYWNNPHGTKEAGGAGVWVPLRSYMERIVFIGIFHHSCHHGLHLHADHLRMQVWRAIPGNFLPFEPRSCSRLDNFGVPQWPILCLCYDRLGGQIRTSRQGGSA